MSPVFEAVILWLATVILWWSGWKEEAAGGIPHRAVAVFLSGWPLFMGWSLSLSPSVSLPGAWVWTLALIVAVAWRMEPSWRWTSVSAGLLFASIYLILQRVAYYPHDWSKIAAPWGASIFIGALAALMLKDAPAQLLSLSVAIAICEGVTAVIFGGVDMVYSGSSLDWIRNWWVAVLCARLCAAIILASARIRRPLARRTGWRRGGERP